MKYMSKSLALLALGATLLQFGGCVANLLADALFGLAPLLL